MYNEEVKKRFIEQYTSSESFRKGCASFFKAAEKFELEWGADLCTRSAEDLQKVVDDVIGVRETTSKRRLSILRSYAEWCIAEGIPDARNETAAIEGASAESLRQKMVANPAHLQKCLDDVFLPESYMSTDDVFRCYFWLAYAGIDENEVMSVKGGSMDFVNMVIKHNGAEYPIYREAVPAIRNCMTLTTFYIYHPRSSHPIESPRADGDTLIRTAGDKSDLQGIRSMVSAKLRKAVREKGNDIVRLSYLKLRLSGIYYRKRELEDRGVRVSFEDFVRSTALAKNPNLLKWELDKMERDHQTDYERWKNTFK